MEGKKSSFVDEFFPQKEASSPPKSDILSSIFPPHSPIVVKDEGLSSTDKIEPSGESFHISQNRNQDGLKKNTDPIIPCEIAEPCLMSSSVYYGCRDDFVLESSSSYKSGSTYNYKNDNEDACNSDLANRGEWWQGSFYY